MTTVYSNQVTETAPHRFGAEASELGWAPGFFPEVIATDLGNGQQLIRDKFHAEVGATYKQVAGCVVLVVWND